MTAKTVTLPQLVAAVQAFRDTDWPPMCSQWDALRVAMQAAIKTYAAESNLTVAQVSEMVK